MRSYYLLNTSKRNSSRSRSSTSLQKISTKSATKEKVNPLTYETLCIRYFLNFWLMISLNILLKTFRTYAAGRFFISLSKNSFMLSTSAPDKPSSSASIFPLSSLSWVNLLVKALLSSLSMFISFYSKPWTISGIQLNS